MSHAVICRFTNRAVSDKPYNYVPVDAFAAAFQKTPIAHDTIAHLAQPFDKSQSREGALVRGPASICLNLRRSKALQIVCQGWRLCACTVCALR